MLLNFSPSKDSHLNSSLSINEASCAVTLARPILILLVCIAHIPGIAGYESNYDQYYDLSSLLAVFIKDFLARGAVPILTVISGYFAYFSFQKHSYFFFIKLKIGRLLLPFILWNVIALVFFYYLWQITGRIVGGIDQIHSPLNFLKATLGVYQLPINPPTYFVRDLFILMLAMPVFEILCKSPLRLMLSIVAYGYFFWSLPGMTFDLNGVIIPLTYRTDSTVFFMLGVSLASMNIKVPHIRRYSAWVFTILLLILGGFISMTISAFNPTAMEYVQARSMIGVLFILAAPALLSQLIATQDFRYARWVKRFSPYTFVLFLSHALTTQVFVMVTHQIFGWQVNESSSIFVQCAYIASYLLFVCSGAIAIFYSYEMAKKSGAKWARPLHRFAHLPKENPRPQSRLGRL